MKNLGIFILLFALVFTACRKNESDIDTTIDVPNPTFLDDYVPTFSQANGDVTGFVVNVNEVPVEGAIVKMGNFMTTTDQFGHFFFTNIDMNAAGTVVQVEKAGYFAGSRRFNAVDDVENRVKIELLDKIFTQTFESEAGGTIDLGSEGTIVFAPNTIQDADGNAYSGVVNVASTWLDPSKAKTLRQMPGNLFGVNNLGEEVVLGTYGMIAVELESEAGEPLNILSGSTATVTTPVPDNMLTNAPSEIPLWSYNEEFGVWVEEGVSTLQNGNYVAEVTHFSFWNHDFPEELVSFTAVITNENGVALENYMVTITELGTTFYGYGHTCEEGIVSGYIPKNKELSIEIRGLCGEVLYTMNIGPFSNDTDLGTIVVPNSDLEATTITGELVDCDGNSLTEGVVIITSSTGTVYEYVNNEAFEVVVSGCTVDNIELTGYNLTEMLQSDSVSVTSGVTNDLGEISVCEVIEDFISLTVDGVTETYFINIEVWRDSSFTYMSTEGDNYLIGFGFTGESVGNYDFPENFIEILSDSNNNWDLNSSNGGFEMFNVTEYGAPGEKIIGEFSGQLINSEVEPPVNVDVSGSFNVTNPN